MTKVLVVMAENALSQVMGNRLGSEITVYTAADSVGARSVMEKHDIDVVLIDIRKDLARALQTMEAVRGTARPPETIVLNSAESVSEAMEARQAGASDEILEPFDLSSLREKIAEAAERRAGRRKRGRRRSITRMFEEVMMAAAFSQAGEFDSAREILRNGDDGEGGEGVEGGGEGMKHRGDPGGKRPGGGG